MQAGKRLDVHVDHGAIKRGPRIRVMALRDSGLSNFLLTS